ncbi:hypothetical protein LMG26696_03593 [Achromobacter pulmonis]|uniref:hypothetical protein n=1 Tax=Achromobacter pulmonis TaxID=1389932 RepID=UPI00146696BA|nr:hypothetical protein [Achromobacter pulmonis]CAB3665392.1 hypothetical protein LMG26696_03593 [Achromobacter pulmonis]
MTNQNNAAQAAMQNPIDEAIVILTEEAAALRECHTPSGERDDWTGESEAKAAHDNMLRVADALSKLRAPVADERVSDDTLWSLAEQIMGGKEAHHVGRDRVLRFARAALASGSSAGWGCAHKNKVANVAAYVWYCHDCAKFIPREPGESALASAPVADERAAFEAKFPLPAHCQWIGNGYAATDYNAWSAHKHKDRWEGWQARAALASAPVAGEAQERIEQMAVNRYRPVPDGKFSYKVVAGDGSRSLYTGTKDSCLRVAAKLTEAFLDGAFVASDASPQSSKDGEHGE